jgi:hypothetical protein
MPKSIARRVLAGCKPISLVASATLRRNQDYDAELRDQSSKLLSSIKQGDAEKVRKGYEKSLEEWNEFRMAKLATHAVHRRTTLKLLRKSLEAFLLMVYSMDGDSLRRCYGATLFG